ncbi:TRAP transporter small permease subunit [Desulfogranum mediterraneum]|uniref:TRAP transporter small permease subunit n=1 Tax=Desulfogranum mediterraneum TaxID=160661 RepID=UPI0005513B08|nr:TRAP transporter small permease subunit [Desulfogranum mediterraneum]
MNILRGLIKTIDAVSEATGKVIIWLVMLLTAVIGYEIFSRYLLNQPTKWAFDLSYMIGGTFFLLGEAWTLKKRQHVRIDILYSRFSKRTRAMIDICLYLVFFFPLWGGILYTLIPYVAFSWEMGERSMQGYWQPIIYPFKTVMPIGVAMLLLQGVAEFLRNLILVCGGGEVR